MQNALTCFTTARLEIYPFQFVGVFRAKLAMSCVHEYHHLPSAAGIGGLDLSSPSGICLGRALSGTVLTLACCHVTLSWRDPTAKFATHVFPPSYLSWEELDGAWLAGFCNTKLLKESLQGGR